jgi:hypothetical protein
MANSSDGYSLRVSAGIWKEMRKGTGESLSPLNEHRHYHEHVVLVAHGLDHLGARLLSLNVISFVKSTYLALWPVI